MTPDNEWADLICAYTYIAVHKTWRLLCSVCLRERARALLITIINLKKATRAVSLYLLAARSLAKEVTHRRRVTLAREQERMRPAVYSSRGRAFHPSYYGSARSSGRPEVVLLAILICSAEAQAPGLVLLDETRDKSRAEKSCTPNHHGSSRGRERAHISRTPSASRAVRGGLVCVRACMRKGHSEVRGGVMGRRGSIGFEERALQKR